MKNETYYFIIESYTKGIFDILKIDWVSQRKRWVAKHMATKKIASPLTDLLKSTNKF